MNLWRSILFNSWSHLRYRPHSLPRSAFFLMMVGPLILWNRGWGAQGLVLLALALLGLAALVGGIMLALRAGVSMGGALIMPAAVLSGSMLGIALDEYRIAWWQEVLIVLAVLLLAVMAISVGQSLLSRKSKSLS